MSGITDRLQGVRNNEAIGIVRCCPRCGQMLLNSCYHDGDDVQAVDMPVAKAIEMNRNVVAGFQNRIKERNEEYEKLREIQEKATRTKAATGG